MFQNYEILYPKLAIQAQVKELAVRLRKEEKDNIPIFIGLLTGCFRFIADFVKYYNRRCFVDFIDVKSYEGTQSRDELKILKDVSLNIKGKDVYLVDDIIDTGLTLVTLKNLLLERGAKSVKTIVLLNKQARRKYDISPDYCCFPDCPDKFVVGYGLDYDGLFRELSDIFALLPPESKFKKEAAVDTNKILEEELAH